jgi:hypothetical protein
MKVIGLTNSLRGAAEEQCPESFRAWIREAKSQTWGNAEELMKRYPTASLLGPDEAHFPLRADGTGVRARIFFRLKLLILLCIAPCPAALRPRVRHRISQPQPQPMSLPQP